jgi:hypothetical protein
METHKTIIARMNINLTINKLLFRIRMEQMTKQKKNNIEQMCKDLDYSISVLDELVRENDRLWRESNEVYKMNLDLQEQLCKRRNDEN